MYNTKLGTGEKRIELMYKAAGLLGGRTDKQTLELLQDVEIEGRNPRKREL